MQKTTKNTINVKAMSMQTKDNSLGGVSMREDIRRRVLECTKYVIDNKTSIRQTALGLNLNRGTVQHDLCYRLPEVDAELHKQVQAIFDDNTVRSGEFRGSTSKRIQCECTECKHNTAVFYNSKGYCTKKRIKLVRKDVQVWDSTYKEVDYQDFTDCADFERGSKGADFYRGEDSV